MGITAVACLTMGTALPTVTMTSTLRLKLGCNLGVALGPALRPPILDRDGTALDPAKLAQARHKGSRPWTKGRSIRAQEPDGRQFARLLRLGHERRKRQPVEERAPVHRPISSMS